MGLFSFFRKNKQESASGQGAFRSRSASEPSTGRSRSANSRKSTRASKDDADDSVLPEKKRARRRLIGAVALVLAVVIVLPMILDSEPRPLADDVAIQIPSKDGKDAAAAPAPAAAAAATAAAAPADNSKLAAASTIEGKEEIVDPGSLAQNNDKPAPPVAAPAPLKTPAVPETPAAAPAPQPEPAKPAPKESKPAKAVEHKEERKEEHKKDAAKDSAKAKSADDARALAILEGKPGSADKKTGAAAGGKFVIQVAALASQDKIDELRGKLNNAGIKSFTQKVATQAGERTRIRVGPFASREEADKMRAKINKLGLNATIVPT